MHEVLVNRLGGLSLPRKSVVRLTDRPDMTLDVYRGRKTTIQYLHLKAKEIWYLFLSISVPEGVNAPTAVSLTPASIELRWEEPDFPNGVISLYTVERRFPDKVAVTTLISLGPNDPKVYVDEDKDLTPYTQYEYRIVVTNGAGEGFSPWVLATTMSSRKLLLNLLIILQMCLTFESGQGIVML